MPHDDPTGLQLSLDSLDEPAEVLVRISNEALAGRPDLADEDGQSSGISDESERPSEAEPAPDTIESHGVAEGTAGTTTGGIITTDDAAQAVEASGAEHVGPPAALDVDLPDVGAASEIAVQPPAQPEPSEPAQPLPVDDPSLQIRLARIHLKTGSLAMARAEFEALAGRDGLDTLARLDLAEARWRTGDLEGAGEAAAAYLSDGGDEALGFVIAAEAAAIANRHAEARRCVEQALERHPSGIDPLFAGIPRRAAWASQTWSPVAVETATVEPSPAAAGVEIEVEAQPVPEPMPEAAPAEPEAAPAVAPAVEPAAVSLELEGTPEPEAAPEAVAPAVEPEAAPAEPEAAPEPETGPEPEAAPAEPEATSEPEAAPEAVAPAVEPAAVQPEPETGPAATPDPEATPAPEAAVESPACAGESVAAEAPSDAAAAAEQPPDAVEANAEVASGRSYLDADDPMMAALHFGVAIRLTPASAGAVLEAIGERQDLPLQLVRGDALRLLGLEGDAGAAYMSVASALGAPKPVAPEPVPEAPAPAPASPEPPAASVYPELPSAPAVEETPPIRWD